MEGTWVPYREVAHLMALGRYREVLGVEDPGELPAGRCGLNISEVKEAMVYSARVVFKEDVELGEWFDNPLMPRELSHSELIACATYA